MKQLSKLYKRTEIGQIQEWSIIVKDNSYYTIEGIKDGKLTESLPTYCEGKNTGKANETSPQEQALKQAIALWKKKKEKGYHEDINNIDNQSAYFEPMLAVKYDDLKDKSLTFPLYAQGKYDGLRCIVTKDSMRSRNGKDFISCPHIQKALQPLFDFNPDYIFDGELYNHEYHDDFDEITSLTKKTKPTNEDIEESAKKIQYHIYDFPFWNGNFSERYAELKKVLSHIKSDSIVLAETRLINNQKELDDYYDELLEAGYEGQMLRFDIGPYENKRSKQLWKRKEFIDDEFIILDMIEGEGNRAGMVGSMCFEMPDGQSFTANVKAKHSKLKEIWEHKNDYIGKEATVKYQNLTPKGKPRFPRVVKIDRKSFE